MPSLSPLASASTAYLCLGTRGCMLNRCYEPANVDGKRENAGEEYGRGTRERGQLWKVIVRDTSTEEHGREEQASGRKQARARGVQCSTFNIGTLHGLRSVLVGARAVQQPPNGRLCPCHVVRSACSLSFFPSSIFPSFLCPWDSPAPPSFTMPWPPSSHRPQVRSQALAT